MRVVALLLLQFFACTDANEPSTPERRVPEPANEPPPPIEAPQAPPNPQQPTAPPTGELACASQLSAPMLAFDRSGPIALAGLNDDFAVAGYLTGEGRDEVFLLRTTHRAIVIPVVRAELPGTSPEPRFAPPALIFDGQRLHLAVTTANGDVLLANLSSEAGLRTPDFIRVGTGADRRFSPAVAKTADGRVAVAWTLGRTPMDIAYALVRDGVAVAQSTLTGSTMHGAAPVFVSGASTELFFVDPVDALAPVYRSALTDSFAAPTVVQSIVSLFDPAEIAVARTGDSLAIGYTAVGQGATTAVGLLRAPGGEGPVALVRGQGYGSLNVAAVSSGPNAVFAMDVPKDRPPGSPREIHVRLASADSLGESLVLAAPDGTGYHATIARALEGTIGIGFVASSGVYLTFLTCP